MLHKRLRPFTQIPQQLCRLSLLHPNMMILTKLLIELLIVQPTASPPSLVWIHEHEMVAVHHELVCDV